MTVTDSVKWAGAEKKEVSHPGLASHILSFVASKTAGSPTDSSKRWVNLRPCDIGRYIFDTYRLRVSNSQTKRILRANGYCPYKPLKRLATGKSPHRETQFEIIAELRSLFDKMRINPVISIDTKKKEPLGMLTRNKPLWSKKGQIPEVHDHSMAAMTTAIWLKARQCPMAFMT